MAPSVSKWQRPLLGFQIEEKLRKAIIDVARVMPPDLLAGLSLAEPARREDSVPPERRLICIATGAERIQQAHFGDQNATHGGKKACWTFVPGKETIKVQMPIQRHHEVRQTRQEMAWKSTVCRLVFFGKWRGVDVSCRQSSSEVRSLKEVARPTAPIRRS